MNDIKASAQPRLVELTVGVLRRLAGLPRPVRRTIAVVIDAMLCIFAIWVAFSLRLGEWNLASTSAAIVATVAVPSWFISAWRFEVYRNIIRSTGNRTMIDLATACAMLALPMILVFLFIGVGDVPRTIALLQPLIFFVLLSVSRLTIRYVVADVLRAGPAQQQRVLIYGAGSAGQQLGQALRHEGHLALAGYVDDDAKLVGQRIDGVRIHAAAAIRELIVELAVDEVLLALPSAPRSRRCEIVESLQDSGARVRSLPSIGNIIDGKVSINDLRDIPVEELLGRNTVPPNEALLGSAITGRVVLVTGAGGSIGGELCRQILSRKPLRLVLLDHSEYALYRIDAELRGMRVEGTDIIPELGDITDWGNAERVLNRWRPHTVFHAAAYKHVPLVEANPLAGLRNNVLGTLRCCLAAENSGAGRFVLISTDKAVRPTNVMGSSKRICELVLQARAELNIGPIFSMVRFGNVLGSSGSVVPKFREQIAAGGPVTLTHRDVTRYFMTIPEAAQLVLQAGAMAAGGEVFVLDMRNPIKIIDLARTMIQLSGRTVRDASNPSGDIAVEEIGLRPGEKMHEELLIGENPETTAHESIMRAHERFLPWGQLERELATLENALEQGDLRRALLTMKALVPECQLSKEEYSGLGGAAAVLGLQMPDHKKSVAGGLLARQR